MIHFVDNNGTIIKTIESPVYQGSAESNNIILIAPFAANLQFTVAFFLPNGEITPRYAMTQGGTLNGVEYAPTNGAMAIWTFSMPNNITQYFGTVYAQFYAYGTNGQITASSRTSFVVARGVPEELPDSPDPTTYNQILTIISQINTALNNGNYAARAIYWWINTYTYGMNEITFYPIGTYGAFVRSTVTGNTGNQPYTDDGVLDSEHWQELVNFNKIYAAEQNAVESAQNAAQSASSAAQSAQTAEKYAADAEEAGSKFSDLVNSGEIGNFVIQGEENKLTWSPNLWDYPNYLQVAKDVYVSETLSSGVRISYESIEVFRSDGDRFTSYEIGQIRDVSEESYNRTFALPSQSGTLALTSDVAAESSAREQADNALQSDIDGIQQQLSETQHFRGYYETTAQVQSISNPHSGDYAWNAQTGTVWNYSASWTDSGVKIPDQTVPKSTTTPLMDGTATLGNTNTYADGAHRHPTDTTRASVTALNSEIGTRTAADSNLQSQIDDIEDGTTVVGKAAADEDGNNIPDTYAKQDGSYPTLGAGYLAKNGIINALQTSQIGWWKVFSIPISALTSISVSSTYSILMEVNGVYDGDEGSGSIEINGRSNSSLWAEANCRILSGNLTPNNYAVAISADGANLEFYAYTERQYTRLAFTVTSEYYSASAVNVINWTVSFSNASAPANAVYAVNVNGAGYLAKNAKIVAGTDTIGWWKIGTLNVQDLGNQSRSSSTIFLVNGLYTHNNPSGLLELNGRILGGSISAADTTLNILSGNLASNDHCIAIDGDVITLYGHLDGQYVSEIYTILQDSSEGAAQVNANLFTFDTEFYGTTAPSGAVYAVNRNVARPLFIANNVQAKTPTVNTDMALDGGVNPDGSIVGDEVIFYCVDDNNNYTCTGKIKSISGTTPTVTITGVVAQGNDGDNNTTYTLTKSGSTITLTGSDGSKTSVTDSDTTYSAGTGLTLSGTTFSLSMPVEVANGGTGVTSLKSLSAVDDMGYNTSADRAKPVTMQAIAFWNGAYQDTTSNLRYCNGGEIVGTTNTQTISGAKTFSQVVKAANPSSSSDTNEAATTAWVRDRINENIGSLYLHKILLTFSTSGTSVGYIYANLVIVSSTSEEYTESTLLTYFRSTLGYDGTNANDVYPATGTGAYNRTAVNINGVNVFRASSVYSLCVRYTTLEGDSGYSISLSNITDKVVSL